MTQKKEQNKTKQTDRFLETSRFSRVPVASEIPSKFYSLHTSIYKIETPHKKYVSRFVKYLTTPHYEKQRKIIIQWKRRVHFGIEKRSNIIQKVGAISQNNWKMQGITS